MSSRRVNPNGPSASSSSGSGSKAPALPPRTVPTAGIKAEIVGNKQASAVRDRYDSEDTWAYVTAAWLVILGLVFIFAQGLVSMILVSAPASTGQVAPSPFTRFMSVQLGITLIAIAVTMLVQTGLFSSQSRVKPEQHLHAASYRTGVVGVVSLMLFITSFYLWNAADVGAFGTLISLANGICSIWGAWVTMFGQTSHISKRTGRDIRTSNFPFRNSTTHATAKKEMGL